MATPREEELDALADLFLGPTEHAQHSQREHSLSEHSLSEHSLSEHSLSEHSLSEHSLSEHSLSDHSSSSDHAQCEQDQHTTPPPEPAQQLSVEGVVLGHLPVSASAWPGQYARIRAEQLGIPVAVVRLSLGSLSIDLFGVEAPEQSISTEADAIEVVRALVGRVILRVDEPMEAQLPSLPAVERLCLLTGADDAAIVACYRKLKGIATAAEATGLPLPAVHLTIMGGDKAKAALAHQRIAGAAQAFLDADLLEPVIISRIGPTGSTTIYRGATDLTLEALCDLLTLPQSHTTVQGLSEPKAQVSQEQDDFVDHESLAHQSGPRVLLSSSSVSTPPPRDVSSNTAAPEASPASQPSLATPSTTAPRVETLTALVAGLVPLDSRCPLADRIELAADAEGRLHLVAGVLASHAERSSADPLGDLLRAAAWARLNAELLCKVESKLTRQTTQPGVHLVTDQAALATSLLDTVIRVHLAIPTTSATPTALGLVAAPLGE